MIDADTSMYTISTDPTGVFNLTFPNPVYAVSFDIVLNDVETPTFATVDVAQNGLAPCNLLSSGRGTRGRYRLPDVDVNQGDSPAFFGYASRCGGVKQIFFGKSYSSLSGDDYRYKAHPPGVNIGVDVGSMKVVPFNEPFN